MVPRVCDLDALAASSGGKIEIESLEEGRDGVILETVNAGLDVSGLAYNPGTGHLFVIANTDAAADLFVLDVNDGYAVVGSFKVAGMGDYDQAGLDADCAGNLYAVNQGTGEVRWMCSWDTTPEDVEAFAAAVAQEMSGSC